MKHVPVTWANYAQHSNRRTERRRTKPSLTVPGQAMSMDELIRRYVRGETVTTFQGNYTLDDNIPDNLERMDEMEKLDLARQLKSGIQHAQEHNARLAKQREMIAANKTPEPLPEPVKEPEPKVL